MQNLRSHLNKGNFAFYHRLDSIVIIIVALDYEVCCDITMDLILQKNIQVYSVFPPSSVFCPPPPITIDVF